MGRPLTQFKQIEEEVAMERMRRRKAVYAAFDRGDPANGVIRLKYLAEIAEFHDVLYIRVEPRESAAK